MNFLYYYDVSKQNLCAINLDAIKVIECRSIKYDFTEFISDNIGFGLYIDNNLVHHFSLKNVYDVYKKLLSDDKEVRKIFDIYCKDFVRNDDEERLIKLTGFENFNKYIKNRKVVVDELFKDYQLDGVQDYIKILECNKRFDRVNVITNYLITLRIFDYYTSMLRSI